MVDHVDDGARESFLGWAPILGEWRLGSVAEYVPPPEPEVPVGLLLARQHAQSGVVRVSVRFPLSEEPSPNARIVFGCDPETRAFYSAGLGGFNALYTIEQLNPQGTSAPVRSAGKPVNLHRDEDYDLSVMFNGQWVSLAVDGVVVLQGPLPTPLPGWQLGLVAWGRGPVVFNDFDVSAQDPAAFVVMQFGEPYDSLYREVIAPVASELGYEPRRADDVFGPGIVLEDIISGIREASVVIAEITPVNANVFYELGYAHATGKPTILLLERGQALPFDIQGYRAIFYDDTIAGKTRVEEDLRRHLSALSAA